MDRLMILSYRDVVVAHRIACTVYSLWINFVRRGKRNFVVCDGSIYLNSYINYHAYHFKAENISNSSHHWTFFSYGNHDLRSGDQPKRYGVNNATAYIDYFNSSICGELRHRHCHPTCPQVWWVSTHRRYQALYPDETPETMLVFNQRMKRFFRSIINVVDVFNMTQDLMLHYPNQAQYLASDATHWGMEINLLKAQLIINAIAQT